MANHSGNYLVVLGSSSDQLFMIRSAQQMGLKVLTIDANSDVPGKLVADVFANISSTDVPAILKFLDQFRQEGATIVGVSTMGSDIPDIVAALAQHLHTPSISTQDAAVAVDKIAMKQRFTDYGVPIPWYREINSYKELAEIIKTRGIELVIKPNDRSGSRGVFLLDYTCDTENLFNKARDFSFSKRVLVEEFLPGLQISTETIMIDGQAYTPGFADRNYGLLDQFRPQIMENAGWVPS
ncbi:MAG: acetyl-CoA carboxylase biotin carboxylase subunit family protein, partial [Thiohalomonadales bacterium]